MFSIKIQENRAKGFHSYDRTYKHTSFTLFSSEFLSIYIFYSLCLLLYFNLIKNGVLSILY